MKIKVRFLCKDSTLMIMFNDNQVNSKWLEELTTELNDFMLSLTGNKSNVKFLMWSTDNSGDGITFLIECDTNLSIEELEQCILRQFRGNNLFSIMQDDLDNFTYNNNDYWIKLLDEIEEDISRWLYPILESIKIEQVEE